ncbi:FxsB family cyclophane-forming radical SAM/SPASM peptide maturase [Nonomuraea sp. NPDC050536]|uniref:FxsB family cyclophane-forming radical SAM/SPASM peptide maturase n=1 Tax=Nonomuraea sp. NPDC050536 TaxID=3364366 RepID=UPI0037CB9B92
MGPPFRQFVLKVHSRCDLACDHCYVYEHADQSWRAKPIRMSEQTARLVAARIAEHVTSHGLDRVHVTLHGGEPLLAGVAGLEAVLGALRAALDPVCDPVLQVHTNGVRLGEEFCELFARYGVRVGISLDGDREANDLHRRYADGRSSHAAVLRAIDLLRARYPGGYAGLLCTIDLANDPIAVYEALLALEPPRIDLLLPHATHDHPPPGRPGDYAAWLIKIFDRWVRDGRPMGIRLFDSVLGRLRGEPSRTEAIGLEPTDLIVVETDGSLEQADSLKTAYDGAPATGFSLTDTGFDAAVTHPGIVARRTGIEGLCETCRECPVVGICGGGLYAHRHSTANGFANPSVYCADLLGLITHIEARAGTPPPLHTLLARHLDELSEGYGSAAAITALAQAQLSIARGLAAAVHRSDAEAWRELNRIERARPDILADLLLHPYFRVWVLDHLAPPGKDPGYLARLAVAGLARAGLAGALTIQPDPEGAIYFPTVGRMTVAPGEPVRVETGEDGIVTAGAGWEPVRTLTTHGLRVRIEDLDPWRDCHHWPPASRLPEQEIQAWQSMLGDAFELIPPEYADALAAGLTTITPLAPGGAERSSTARHAFGAVAVARPGSPESLAKLLMHEFQHVKLGAVLDLFELTIRREPEPRYRVAWRDDPRPLEAILQGTYAHIAVTDFWRTRREDEFARWHSATLDGARILLDSGRLTPLGERFVGGMRATLAAFY